MNTLYRNRKQRTRWAKMEEVSSRIAEMRKRMLETVPEIFSDRAQLITESYAETFGKPMIERRALALEKILMGMKICIPDGELIVGGMAGKPRGCQIFPEYDMGFVANELDSFNNRRADRFYVTEENKRILRLIHEKWLNNTLTDTALSFFPEEEKEAAGDLVFVLTALRSGVGHIIIDYEHAIARGLISYIDDAKKRLMALSVNDPEYVRKAAFYRSVQTVCQGVIGFANRYAILARELSIKEQNSQRKRELLVIAEICETVPAQRAQNFREALQSFWFIHLVLQLESNGHSVSPGRFDQYIYPYYRKDIQENLIDPAFSEEIIHCLWLKFFEINKVRDRVSSIAFGGYPMFQNIILGGQCSDGSGGVNELSHLCLEATAKVGLPQPSLSVRWYYGCPDEFFRHVFEIIAYGTGLPALFNDEVLIPNMLQLGYTLEESRNYAIVGCTETTVPAITEPWLTGGFLNLLKVLELSVFDGYDPVTGKQYPAHPGEVSGFQDFEHFYDAYLQRIYRYIRQMILCDNILDSLHGSLCPTPFEAVFIAGCMESGKTSLEGGARYNFSTIEIVGIANVADSLAAIKKLVYEEKRVTWEELKEAMLHNFENYEILRMLLINGAPKYGNDDDYVDSIAVRVLNDLRTEVDNYRNPRGGIYNVALYSIATHVLFAEKTGATPDGRRLGEVLADGGVSCGHGLDTHGLTALLKSVVKLDPFKATGSTLLNVKLNPAILSDENYKRTMDVIKTYFLLKGQHIQFNVIDVETLREAQKNPERFSSLTVRVAGFSVLFTTIDPLLQEDIIKRTEHTSGG